MGKPRRLPYPVISIGNLTVGGTGKTPAVMALAERAKETGFHPVILTRGYRGGRKGSCFVSTGAGPLYSPQETGDEPYLMAKRLKGVTIVKGADRYEAGMLAINRSEGGLDKEGKGPLFIVDDGFQHWGLQRDIDILLIDAVNPFGNGKLLPEGILREPLSSIKRADLIVLTKSDLIDERSIAETAETIRKTAPQTPVFRARHRPAELIAPDGTTHRTDSFRGRRVLAFAGIANPVYFQALLRAVGMDIVDFIPFRDHHDYSEGDIQEIKSRAMGLDMVTTEKDLVKLEGASLPGNLYALRIEFSVDAELYENIFRRLS
jgi:tetraacyldisaccharide 4'-kinase